MYEFSMIPTIKRLTRVTKHTATAIDGIVTNCILNSNFKNSIVKTDFLTTSQLNLLMSLYKALRKIWKNMYTGETLLKTHF